MNAFTSCQNTGAEPRPLVLATLLWFLYARSIFLEMALGRVILKRTAQGKSWLPRSSAICVGLGSGLSVSVKVFGRGLTEMSSRQEIPKIIFWYFLVVRHFTLSTPTVSFHVTLYFLTATKSPETLTNRLIVRYVMAWTLFCIMKHAHVFVFTSRRWGLSQLCGVWYEHDECCKARFLCVCPCVCVRACACLHAHDACVCVWNFHVGFFKNFHVVRRFVAKSWKWKFCFPIFIFGLLSDTVWKMNRFKILLRKCIFVSYRPVDNIYLLDWNKMKIDFLRVFTMFCRRRIMLISSQISIALSLNK